MIFFRSFSILKIHQHAHDKRKGQNIQNDQKLTELHRKCKRKEERENV